MTHEPPRFVTWLLRRILPDDVVGASILGDLREEYEQNEPGRRLRYLGAALALSIRYAAVRVHVGLRRLVRRRSPADMPRRSVWRMVIEDFRDAWRGLRRRPLFAAAGVTLMRYEDQRQRVFFDEATSDLRSIPGVTSVELSLFAPLSGAMPTGFSRAPDDEHPRTLFLNAVSPGLLAALRLPLLEGRGFHAADDERRERVALVSRLAAAAMFPDESPVGRTVYRGKEAYRIVGIVADVRQEGPLEEPRPMIYVVLALLGVTLGTLLAIKATHVLESLLYRTEPGDPVMFVAAAAVTLAIALVAVITPAIRAARVDPVTALRVE